jgi:hypothetical protein
MLMNEEPQNTTPVTPQALAPQHAAPITELPTQPQQPFNAAPSFSQPMQPNSFGSGNSFGFGFGRSRQMSGRGSGIFLLIFGIVFAGAGYFILQSSSIPSSYKRESGQIVQVAPVYSNSSNSNSYSNGYQQNVSYAPVISYKVDGASYTFQASGSSSSRPVIGSSVIVAYNPQNPGQKPKDASDHSAKILAPIFMAVGGIVAIFGLYKLIKG